MLGKIGAKNHLPDSAPAAISHPMLGPVTVRVLCLTMLFAILAGLLEWQYLERQEVVSSIEGVALYVIEIGLTAVFFLLFLLRGKYLGKIAMAVFAGAIFYIFSMLASALFIDRDLARSLHTVLWFHPAFIAVTLTQPVKIAQSACWLVIILLAGVIFYFGVTHVDAPLFSTALVNHWIIIFSLCASASLLYGLSIYRENMGADRARIAVLQDAAIVLRAEMAQKDQARAELEQANRVVTSFLDNMSHELRTPLNAIIGFSELIRDELFGAHANPKYKEYAGDILGSGQHLLGMIDKLIYFSHLSAGKIALKRIELNALELLNEVADAFHFKLQEAHLAIEVNAPDELVITADQDGLMRILNILMDNAIKFSKPGGNILIQARKLDDGACEISVRDAGIGVAETELAGIFSKVQQGERSEKSATPGIGVGLVMAKLLTDLHGGMISIQSREGAGTCVFVTLPMRS